MKKTRIWIFTGFVVICAAFGLIYVFASAARNAPQATHLVIESAAATRQTSNLREIVSQPHILTLNRVVAGNYGRVQFHPLAGPDNAQTSTGMLCERIYFAATRGVCLIRTPSNPFVAIVSATIFGPDLQALFSLPGEGIPSRVRVSPDGRYAAFTTFVGGDSYLDSQFSTRTMIIDIDSQQYLGNLESFQVFRDGQAFRSVDFNFWGVTFADDSNLFYATLRTKGENWLVQGDVRQKRMQLMHKEVECPSLSPDGTRIAFKKLQSNKTWRLYVLDLATMAETPLAETRNIDDQVEWLDNQHVIYEWSQAGSGKMDVREANADGSGVSTVFLADAGSPAVIRAVSLKKGNAP